MRLRVFVICLVLFAHVAPSLGCGSDGRYIMGTVLEITLCDQSTPASQHTFDTLFASAAQLDALLSTFSPDSAISFLNAHAGQGDFSTPPEVINLLQMSQRYWRLTHGTFDVTVGPLLQLWHNAGDTQTLPSPAQLRRAQMKVGSDKIKVLPNAHVAFTRPGMIVNLGGIGKGYALDQMVGQGLKNALLNFGQSSVWALGSPPDAPRWRLLIQQPNGRQVGVIALYNQALSISGSFGQSFTIKGRTYGHIIDPRSGMPLQQDQLACVVAPSATLAEALSKALLILGERKGLDLIQQLPGVEGLLLTANGQQWRTKGWNQATAFTMDGQ
jgi:thiamine biosynthesis lipoprotein